MKKVIASKRLWICLMVLAVVAVGAGVVSMARKAYTGPLHCQSCHVDQTERWRASGPHSAGTTCTDCHGPNSGIVPNTPNILKYYRDAVLPTHLVASPEVMSGNCLTCHESVLDGSHVTKKTIVVSHRVHWQEGMICLDCHRNVSHDLMAGRTYRPTKKVCYECHLRDIDVGSSQDRSCTNCHRIILARDPQQAGTRTSS